MASNAVKNAVVNALGDNYTPDKLQKVKMLMQKRGESVRQVLRAVKKGEVAL